MKTYCYLLFLVIFFSCQKNDFRVINEQEFNSEIQLNLSRITTNELLSVDDFFVKDSFVVVHNNREDSLFIIYKLPNFNCIRAFGKQGKGPDEFIMPKIVDNSSLEQFMIADFALNKLSIYYLHNNQIENIRFNSSANKYLPQSIIYTSDSNFIFDSNQQMVRLHKMRIDGASTILNDFKELQNRYIHSNAYWGFLGVNDSLKRIVYAYQYLRRFDIMDFNGKILEKIKILPDTEPILNNNRLDANNSMNYFFGVRTTTKSFFLYYIGHTGEELANDLNVTTYIEEYDWDGNPLKRYKINQY